MAQFDESKVINALHPEEAEVGKAYWCSDILCILKKHVEADSKTNVYRLDNKVYKSSHPFQTANIEWQFLYPYEEPPKKRMTTRQFAEWLMKGNGEYTYESYESTYATYSYRKCVEDYELDKGIRIRSWDSKEWIEPTVDIYERDCKGVTK